MRSLVIFVDLFSLLAIALFVVFVVSSGQEEAVTSVDVRMVELRLSRPEVLLKGLDYRPEIGRFLRLGAKLVSGDTGEFIDEEAGEDWELIETETFDGLQVVVRGTPPENSVVRFVVVDVVDPRAYLGEFEAQLLRSYPEEDQQREGNIVVGNWSDPGIGLE